MLLFLCQYRSQAKLLHHRGLQFTRERSRDWSQDRKVADSLRCSGKAICRHAAFLYWTLGKPPFMQCSITCLLSPDWVALMCKYLQYKEAVWDWQNTEEHWDTENSSLKARLLRSLFKTTVYLFFFISLTVSSSHMGWIYMGIHSFSPTIHWKLAADLHPPPPSSVKEVLENHEGCGLSKAQQPIFESSSVPVFVLLVSFQFTLV